MKLRIVVLYRVGLVLYDGPFLVLGAFSELALSEPGLDPPELALRTPPSAAYCASYYAALQSPLHEKAIRFNPSLSSTAVHTS